MTKNGSDQGAPEPANRETEQALSEALAEQERLRREVAHWRGLYEQLVEDARANITDAEGQIESARTHIRQLEEHLDEELGRWQDRYDALADEARSNITDAEGQVESARGEIERLVGLLETARENATLFEAERKQAQAVIQGLVDDIERSREDRARLVAEIGLWSQRAEPDRRPAGLLGRLRNAMRGSRASEPIRSPVPAGVLRARQKVSQRFLRGAGIEIGALHSPMPVASGVSVTYVDRISRPEQRASFTELRDYPFVEVDVIDDGERLDSIEDGSLDFVVASHMLEHCENPLGTIRHHAAKLRPGGHLLYVIPDKRFSFDEKRPVTPFEHLVRDDREGPATSRREHLLEYARLVDAFPEDEVERAADRMEAAGADIHFHVWDEAAAEALWRGVQDYLEIPLSIEYTGFNAVENIAVLRRGA